MKYLVFTLTLTLSTSLFGMMQHAGSNLGSDYAALFQEAIAHAHNRQNREAAKYLMWIATHDTDTYRVAACYYGLGNMYAQNKKYKIAKDYLKRAAYNHHENLLVRAQALLDLGQLYSRENKSEKAICHYKRAFNESDDADIQRDALNYYIDEKEFTQIAHILLDLKQDSFDQSYDKATQPSKKRHTSESSGELLSSRLAQESLLAKMKQ